MFSFILILVLAAGPGATEGRMACGPFPTIKRIYIDPKGAQLVTTLLTGKNNLVELWVAPPKADERQPWVILAVAGDGTACVMAEGVVVVEHALLPARAS